MNILDQNGLILDTYEDLITFLEAKFRLIYGNDIVLEPDTPDGQLLRIFAQMQMDRINDIRQYFSSLDPDQAIGRVLDLRVSFNGIQRLGGTRSTINVLITIDRIVPLSGTDTDNPFTITDEQGQQWQLIESIVLNSIGNHLLIFQSSTIGKVQAAPSTLNRMVTVVLGVTDVINPTVPISIGMDEETDYALKIRRQQSVSLPSQGFRAGMKAALSNINGVTLANVHENKTSTVVNGIPAHGIWIILEGQYDIDEVGEVIAIKRNAGCNMRGDIVYNYTDEFGEVDTVNWDNVEEEDIFVKAVIETIDGSKTPDLDNLRNGIPQLITTESGVNINSNNIVKAIQDLDENILVDSALLSLSVIGSYDNILRPSSLKNKFILKPENIIITPMVIVPYNPRVGLNEPRQFEGRGGYGEYTFDIVINNSGATIDSDGIYTSGPNPGVDTVRVTDELGNEAQTEVRVG